MRSVIRAGVLDRLDARVTTGSAGRGQVVVLSGEAGIGKSSLATSLSDRRHGLERVLWGACEPLAVAVALLPFHDFARGLPPSAAAALSGALAEDADRHAAVGVLLDLIGDRPTLAVVEDAHWADEASLDLLVFLARRIADLPVTLLVTARTDEPSSGPRVGEVLRHIAALPHGDQVHVPSLSLVEVGILTAGSGLDAAHVHAVTGGNAFFVTELVALGDADRDNAGPDDGDPDERVPRSVRDAVLARADRLTPGARAVLEGVAVIPDRAEIELVYAVTLASTDDLDIAERAQLLISDGRTVAFRHELARTAVSESLSGARRRELHRRILAELLGRPQPPVSRVAFHADLAGDHEAAVLFGVRAAHESMGHRAHHEACVQLARVRPHLCEVEPDSAGEALALEALVLHRAARLEEALEVSTAAYDVWRGLGDGDRAAGQLSHNARLLWNLGRTAEARTVLSAAVRTGERVPGSAGHLAAITQQAISLMLTGRSLDAVAVGHQAAALAHRRGDRAQEAIALNAVGSASWSCDVDQAEPLLVQALELARDAGDDTQAATILVNLGSGAAEIRRYGVALRWLAECRSWCEERDIDLTGDYAGAWQARIALEKGEWDHVAALARPLVTSRSPIARMGASTTLGRLAVRRGERQAADMLEAVWSQVEPTGDLQRLWPIAAGWAELGDLERAAVIFVQAVDEKNAWAVGELGWALVRAARLSASNPALAMAAAPYAAQIAGRHRDAARQWDLLGCPYEAALAWADTGEPERLVATVATLHRLGARAGADHVAAQLRAVAPELVPRRPRRTTVADAHGLTNREREVLALVRDGLTNVEISARIFISPKTAEHHVSAILAKLGVSSRREAARVGFGKNGASRPM